MRGFQRSFRRLDGPLRDFKESFSRPLCLTVSEGPWRTFLNRLREVWRCIRGFEDVPVVLEKVLEASG